MDATQQHMFDLYRSARHDLPAPPAPGTGEWHLVREFRTRRAFRAVVDERVAARRARWAAVLGRLRRPAAPARTAPARTAAPGPAGAGDTARPVPGARR
ncbi:hypothetical protein [Streptomyces griseocarneus]|uniref:hypothetical protein n=1 Tax=Streptomyces griseocarneus TaxID=51201 RepID=UPI00167C9B2C|nr:hypothetical protein [Streptomyces griseocarneus]GHG81834.1 hypothetical protein GCM10018779_64210 [Streptomyces griseocarneus]